MCMVSSFDRLPRLRTAHTFTAAGLIVNYDKLKVPTINSLEITPRPEPRHPLVLVICPTVAKALTASSPTLSDSHFDRRRHLTSVLITSATDAPLKSAAPTNIHTDP